MWPEVARFRQRQHAGPMNTDRRTAVAVLAGAGLLWGTTVPLTKLALEWLPPAWLTVARFGLAAAVLLAVAGSRVRGASSPAVLAWGAVGLRRVDPGPERRDHPDQREPCRPARRRHPGAGGGVAAVHHRRAAPPVAWTGFAVSFAGVAWSPPAGVPAPPSPATAWSWPRWPSRPPSRSRPRRGRGPSAMPSRPMSWACR